MKPQVAITDLSECRKELLIEVAAYQVMAEYEKIYEAYARQTNLPGFRPGRVPRGVIKQHFAKEITEQIVGSLLRPALERAIKDHKLNVIGEPQLTALSVSEGEPLKATVSVEVLPEFELKEYKGLKATKRVARVTNEDVERTLERLRENAAEFVPVEDRPARDGDFVSVNLAGKYVEPPGGEELKADDVQIELGGEGTLAGFTENLRGVVAGDVRRVRIEYPENFGSPELAGKTLDFTATVVAVRRKELPELDDDFALDVGAYRNLQEMRDGIRKSLAATAHAQAGDRLRGELMEQLLSAYDFDVPPSMVESQTKQRTEELIHHLLQSGIPPETIKTINWAAQTEELRKQAVKDVRSLFVVAGINQAENISVTERDVDTEILKLAALNGEPPMQLKARLTKDNALSSIENTLRYQRALDVIADHAEITVEESTENR